MCDVCNTVCRAYVDESEAAVAELTAKKTFSRQQLWDTAENADSFDGIGPMDRFGLTKELQVARAAHASQYTTLLRAGRTAASRKYLTQEEGSEDDRNLGMKPYRCVLTAAAGIGVGGHVIAMLHCAAIVPTQRTRSIYNSRKCDVQRALRSHKRDSALSDA
jgi:hypothetical protein